VPLSKHVTHYHDYGPWSGFLYYKLTISPPIEGALYPSPLPSCSIICKTVRYIDHSDNCSCCVLSFVT